ncbi:hypothetical protein Tco_0930785 [Tanacetum coccineum]
MPTDPHHTPIQPLTSQPQKKQRSRRPKKKDIEVPQPSGPTDNIVDKVVYEERDASLVRAATTATGLDAEQVSGNINKTQSKATPNEPSSLGTSSGGGPGRQETIGNTIAQTRVLDLENTKTAQAQEITSLKLRVKKLEKKKGSRTHKLKRLYKVGRSVRIVSSDEASLGDQQDASKHGRKINDIDKDAEITLVDETQGRHDDDIMFDVSDLAGEEVFVAEQGVSNKDVNLSVDEVTLAQALAALKIASTRPKAKGLVIHEEEQATTPTVSSQQLSQVKAHDKGKGIMACQRKAQQVKEANIIVGDNVQAIIDADYQMAQQMQAEEQEKLSIKEKSKLFVQLLEARKKHFVAMRA